MLTARTPRKRELHAMALDARPGFASTTYASVEESKSHITQEVVIRCQDSRKQKTQG